MRRLKLAMLLSAAALLPLASAGAATLRFAELQEINSMDPHAARDDFALSLLSNVYEGLVR